MKGKHYIANISLKVHSLAAVCRVRDVLLTRQFIFMLFMEKFKTTLRVLILLDTAEYKS